MEWISEGVTLLSTSVFVAAVTAVDPEATVSSVVCAVAIGPLIVFAIVSLFTGFKVAFLPFRLCPFIFGVSAALIAGAHGFDSLADGIRTTTFERLWTSDHGSS